MYELVDVEEVRRNRDREFRTDYPKSGRCAAPMKLNGGYQRHERALVVEIEHTDSYGVHYFHGMGQLIEAVCEDRFTGASMGPKGSP